MKNIAGKIRLVTNPYASWTNPATGWRYKLLKSWQGDNSKLYARWLVDVEGFGHDVGDEYVIRMLNGLQIELINENLWFDTTVWPTSKDFYNWAWGRKE